MSAKTEGKPRDPLVEMLEAAGREDLVNLIVALAKTRPDVRRACFEYLEKHVASSPENRGDAEGELAFSIWDDLEFDISELDQYGGGDCDLVDRVSDLLWDLEKKLKQGGVSREYRRDLLDEVLPYISSRNSGMEDQLYDVAYAACYDDGDLRDLAGRFERIGQDWPIDHARRICREIGDRDKYLELRSRRMKYGLDYYDLATFYWDDGEKERALEVARRGLEEGEGRMDELRLFVAQRAGESGDRGQYLKLHFEQAIDDLTCEKYKAFERICNAEEWREYEPRLLERIPRCWRDEQLKIYMHRREYGQALTLLQDMRPGDPRYHGVYVMKAAEELEESFPEEIIAFYRSGLGGLDSTRPRNEYARLAEIVAKVRHVYVDILKAHEEWAAFARREKEANIRRPAFQQEFARVVPGWKEIA